MDDLNTNSKSNTLRKSASTIGFSSNYTNFSLREARSFTGALEELKSQNNIKLSKPFQVLVLIFFLLNAYYICSYKEM